MKKYVIPAINLVVLGNEELIRTSGLSIQDNESVDNMEGIDFSQWN